MFRWTVTSDGNQNLEGVVIEGYLVIKDGVRVYEGKGPVTYPPMEPPAPAPAQPLSGSGDTPHFKMTKGDNLFSFELTKPSHVHIAWGEIPGTLPTSIKAEMKGEGFVFNSAGNQYGAIDNSPDANMVLPVGKYTLNLNSTTDCGTGLVISLATSLPRTPVKQTPQTHVPGSF